MATQASIDRFYRVTNKGQPCCAGCDLWQWHNSVAGECIKNAPVPGSERLRMAGITWISTPVSAGHIMTDRDHSCGDFIDTYNWPESPLKIIGKSK